jgi:protease PrsW
MDSLGIAIVASASCLPYLLVCCYFLRRRSPPESLVVIHRYFLTGLFSFLLVWVIAAPLREFTPGFSNHPIVLGFYEAFVLAAVPEELVRLYLVRRRFARTAGPLTGHRCLLLGAILGLGLAMIENVLFCLKLGWVVAWQRAVTALPAHALCGAIIGYFAGLAMVTRQSKWALLGFAITVTLHGSYDVNVKYFYCTVPYDEASIPTEGWHALLITCWPTQILTLLLMLTITVCLVRRNWSATQWNATA